MTHWRAVVAIGLGAVMGALSRCGVDWLADQLGWSLAVGTFLVNVTGCGAIGWAAKLCEQPHWAVYPERRLLLITGFLGSYTTFASYELDSARLWAAHLWGADFFYWAGSSLVGWAFLELGLWLGTRFTR
ncbi:MAG: CrcB family protein [Gloeomargarita sp. SKYG116]|nr:CrcB family protein [Gloeomargarita sp. SKYG116]MDW8400960.1 CrcB family protein [Gloeomargarita sp. SKYGB_i_bin116]